MKSITCPEFRKCLFLILLLMLTASSFASALSATPDPSGTPERTARYGEPVRLIYQPADSTGIIGVEAKITVKPAADPVLVHLEKIDDSWETVYSVKDTTVRAFMVDYMANYLQAGTPGDFNRVEWIILTRSDGRPVRGAYETRALLRAGSKSLSSELLSEAERDVVLELEEYPDNWSCRMLLYSLWMRKLEGNVQASDRIRKNVDSVLTAFGENPETLVFASEALRRAGDAGGAERMTRRLIQIDPNGAAGISARLDSILALENPSERMIRIEKWLRTTPASPLVWKAWEALGTAAIGLGDSIRMSAAADTLVRSPLPQSSAVLAALAGAMMEKGYRLDLAQACAERSLELFDSADSTQPPPGVAMDDWMEQRKLTRARVAGTLGWIFHLRGDIESAVRNLEYSSQNLLEPGVFSHLAQAYERTGAPSRALTYYARVVAFGGDAGEEARQSFNALWTRLGLNAEDMRVLLAEQSNWVDAEYRGKILGREIDRSAPDLNLRDLNGRKVRLSDQQGVIVLCFWATWSRSSQKMLDELQVLAEFRGDVLFLTVALDRESDEVYNFISDRKIGLPVLMDDGSSESYGLEGVPTVLVLDAERYIRFEHRGYRPDIRNLLITEIESLISRKTN